MTDQSNRVRKVERELFETLSKFLLSGFATPTPGYVSITAVEASPDCRYARVFFRLVGDDQTVKETKKILADSRGRFQKEISTKLKMKFCPILKFEYGQVEKRDDIDVLLENLHKSKRFGD